MQIGGCNRTAAIDADVNKDMRSRSGVDVRDEAAGSLIGRQQIGISVGIAFDQPVERLPVEVPSENGTSFAAF